MSRLLCHISVLDFVSVKLWAYISSYGVLDRLINEREGGQGQIQGVEQMPSHPPF